MKFRFALLFSILLAACDEMPSRPPTSSSGVQQTTTQVQTGSDGLTVEQRNVADRLKMDNKVGSIKHLYVISDTSGQVLIYSTVRGKVSSSGKRLSPTTVSTGCGSSTYESCWGIPVTIAGATRRTPEVIQDDGTYGTSVDYIYWWDTKGVYHQHYPSAGQIIHISDQPLAVKSIVLNMELTSSTN